MRPSTPEQIQGLRDFVNYCATGIHHAVVGKLVDVEYYTINLGDSAPFELSVAAAFPEMSPETFNDDSVGIIAVDESVPEELRAYWAVHEKIDFTILGHKHPRRCRTSEQIVQTLLEPPLEETYRINRSRFYRNLGEYALNAAAGDTFDGNDISEMYYLADKLSGI